MSRKFLLILTTASIMLLSASMCLAQSSFEFYVSPTGSDANDGSINAPFATLQKVQSTVRAINKIGLTDPIHIFLREGTYVQNTPLILDENDSGIASAPVVWQSYPGETATVSAGTALSPNWSVYQGNIYVADVTSQFNSLYDGESRLQRARTPNTGYFQIPAPSPSDSFKVIATNPGDINANWFNPNNPMEAVSLSTFQQSRQRVTAIYNNEIFTEFWAAHEHNEKYYVENFLEAVDSPGEWYLDKANNKLYLWPTGSIGQVDLIAGNLVNLIKIEGSASPAEHIHIAGITFAHTDWNLDSHLPAPGCGSFCVKGYRGSQGVVYSNQPAAIELVNTDAIVLSQNEIRNIGTAAIQVSRSDNSQIVHNDIHDIGAGGIRVGEIHSDCHYADLNTANNVYNCYHQNPALASTEWADATNIADNEIHDIGKTFHEGIGVLVTFSRDTSVEHNYVHNTGYSGIAVGWTFTAGDIQEVATQNNTVSQNHLHDVMSIMNDGGAIYTLGYSPNTLIDNNLVQNLVPDSAVYDPQRTALFGLYHDEGSRGLTVTNNMVCAESPQKASGTAAIFLHGPFYNTIENNVFADGQYLQLNFTNRWPFVDPDLGITPEGNIFRQNIVFGDTQNQPYLNKIFEPAWGVNSSLGESHSNVYWPSFNPANGSLQWWQNLTFFDLNSLGQDPLLINHCSKDFSLSVSSPAVTNFGFQQIDLTNVGTRPATAVIEANKTSNSVKHPWYSLSFQQQYTVPFVLLGAMQTTDGGDTADIRFRNLNSSNVQVKIQEEKSKNSEVRHTTEVVGYTLLTSGIVKDAGGTIIGEAGTVVGDDQWQTITLHNTYTQPVVIMNIVSNNDTDPAHIRINNVTSTSFDYQIEEWEYQNQVHGDEVIHYVVVEAGTHDLAEGHTMEAGVFTGNHSWKTINFNQTFNASPVVLTQTQTVNEVTAVVTRQKSVTTSSFRVKIDEEEASDRQHTLETTGYLAIN